MASYDGLLTAEQAWPVRLGFPDAWISDIFTKDAETAAAALPSTFTANSSDSDVLSRELVGSLFSKPDASPVQTPTVSGRSENDASVPKQRRSIPPKGRTGKRKSRPSKRASTTTTFIAADPAIFRWMVQQVTSGVEEAPPMTAVQNPEPRWEMNQTGVGLPALDTSSFLLNGSGSAPYDGGAAEPFCSFPTLESWKAT